MSIRVKVKKDIRYIIGIADRVKK